MRFESAGQLGFVAALCSADADLGDLMSLKQDPWPGAGPIQMPSVLLGALCRCWRELGHSARCGTLEREPKAARSRVTARSCSYSHRVTGDSSRAGPILWDGWRPTERGSPLTP